MYTLYDNTCRLPLLCVDFKTLNGKSCIFSVGISRNTLSMLPSASGQLKSKLWNVLTEIFPILASPYK